MLGLHCCAWAFSSCGERELLLLTVHRLHIAMVSLVVEHGLYLGPWASVAVVHRLSCPVKCGIFLGRGFFTIGPPEKSWF